MPIQANLGCESQSQCGHDLMPFSRLPSTASPFHRLLLTILQYQTDILTFTVILFVSLCHPLQQYGESHDSIDSPTKGCCGKSWWRNVKTITNVCSSIQAPPSEYLQIVLTYR